jgi:sugar phosphate isomerase/epimerase
MMRLAVVVSTHAAAFQAVAFKGSFAEHVAKIAAWGYDGVEIAIRDPRLVDVGELQRVVGGHGLTVPAIGTGQAWGEERLSFTSDDRCVREAAVQRIKSHIPLAEQLGATIILGLIRGMTPPGQTHERSMDLLVEAIRECCSAAGGSGVRFALEPLNRYETDLVHTVAEGLGLVDKIGAENFGLLLDTFHMNIEERVIEDAIRAGSDRIFHFHVADSDRRHPGAGHLDFALILDTLSAVGYEGFVSGEFMPWPNGDTAAERNIRFLREVERRQAVEPVSGV